MNVDDIISLKTASRKGGEALGNGRTLTQWSFEKQIAGLSLAQRNLDIPDKQFVSCIRIDPCSNQFLLSGDNIGKVRLFDLGVLDDRSHSRREVASSNSTDHPQCHRKMITSLSWYPLDSGLFLSSSVDKHVNIWDTNAFDIVSSIRFKNPVSDVQMPTSDSFTHKTAAVCNGIDGVTLVDLFAGTHAQTITGCGGVGMSCCWNPRNEYELLVGDTSGQCTLFDIRKPGEKAVLGVLGEVYPCPSGGSPFTAHRSSVTSCQYSTDGRLIVTCAAEPNPVRVVDAVTLTLRETVIDAVAPWGRVVLKPCIAGNGEKDYLCYPDGKRCVVRVLDLDSGAEVNTLRGHLDVVTCCSFRQKTGELFSGGRDGLILCYNTSGWNCSGVKRFRHAALSDEEDDWEE